MNLWRIVLSLVEVSKQIHAPKRFDFFCMTRVALRLPVAINIFPGKTSAIAALLSFFQGLNTQNDKYIITHATAAPNHYTSTSLSIQGKPTPPKLLASQAFTAGRLVREQLKP